ncbi:pyridoxamine 5'-phosphate oxidase family protein [Burkholderia sp. LS-044]|uniref:pyridoxamine 5'-phosphate oxidase family protein n=1 Tax=Burkholderia sp. LS-044 TaxID=1459967 RepID=UPI0010A60DD1|nr:pyridoxamine 5'-phosphate oxidase family protein [Burkholderia sp. LS-044]THJ46004.1 pyridoxamine 5'-phosphate oxidase family protein [Burkholderia sp. LS-044]
MNELRSLQERTFWLIRNTRFMTLATSDNNGEPWASTVNYVPVVDHQIHLLWYSMKGARHSLNITTRSGVTGSIFRADLVPALSPLGLDGIQFGGIAREVDESSAIAMHAAYYRLNFPDEAIRQNWMLPIDEFIGSGVRRFYKLTIDAWWLLDIDQWLRNKEDRRVELPSPDQLALEFGVTLANTL